MFDLIAEGSQTNQRWRKKIRDSEWHVIGRTSGVFSVDWDPQLSRRHASLRQIKGGVEVERFPEATNPVFFEGRQVQYFKLKANQHFVIGQTRFTLIHSEAFATQDVPSPIHQLTFSDQFLRGLDYRDANQRLNVLNRLPELIAGAGSEEQLLDRLASVLLEGIPLAEIVSIVKQNADGQSIDVIHWDSRGEMVCPFQPSGSLIRQAVESGETVLHVWRETPEGGSNYTIEQHADWAFVCPLKGSVCHGQAIYVSGMLARVGATITTELLHDDLKFSQLVGSTYTNVIELESLQRRQAALRSFFSPVVVEAFAGRDPDKVLEPRACQLSVLFCDLRGFSATSEQMSENLIELLNRVSRALGVMTSCILSGRGVVGDFHGDAVMGFWGWPLEQTDACERAARTAIEITNQFDQLYDSVEFPLSQFMMGLGIASGTAVAGKIGTSDQVKVTAFGPVVNLASRLEGMTRLFKVPILCDENTAKSLISSSVMADCRMRRLAKVIPAGFQRPADVYQIIPRVPMFDQISDKDFDEYTRGLELFEQKNWSPALEIFESLPTEDLGRQFVMEFIKANDLVPPSDWNGAISIPNK